MARVIAILGVFGVLGLGVLGVTGFAGCSADSDVSRTLGARCDSAAECDDRCLPSEGFPGGFCSTSCERGGDCAAGASCVDTEGGVCLIDCAADPDCAFLGEGWHCLELLQREDPTRKLMACAGVRR